MEDHPPLPLVIFWDEMEGPKQLDFPRTCQIRQPVNANPHPRLHLAAAGVSWRPLLLKAPNRHPV